jgi:uncharacterized RDD family membrane protein YckC
VNEFSPSLWNGGQQDHAVETPEQVSLHFPLAGLGSRFLAVMIDLLIQGAANFVLIIVIALVFSAVEKTGGLRHVSDTAAKWFTAGIILFYFVLYWGYFSLFEAFRNGQTPGKRVLNIRVIKDSGRQITFFEALARNLLRVVDWLPGIYLVGMISILVTKQNKRLGDLVADTIVVHERAEEFSGYMGVPFQPATFATPGAEPVSGIPADRIARLSSEDLLLIDSYLARALSLPLETRAQLASRLLDGFCVKMGIAVPTQTPPERTLEALAYALRGYGVR